MKINLDNYDGLIDPREYVQHVRISLKLVMYDNNMMCKGLCEHETII